MRRSTLLAAVVAVSALAATVSADDTPETYFSTRAPGVATRIAIGPDGTIVVAGDATATDSPGSLPAPPVPAGGGLHFVTVLERDGTPRWTAYLAHPNFSLSPNSLNCVTAAPDGSVWIGGDGWISPIHALQPNAGDTTDGWFAKLTPQGAVAFATHLGGAAYDGVNAIAVDTDGSAIVCGSTASDDFPAPPVDTVGTQMFVARVRADGSALAWVQRFGDTLGHAVTIVGDGSVVAAGVSWSLSAETSVPFPFASVLRPPQGASRRGNRAGASVARMVRIDPTGRVVLGGASLPFLGDAEATYSPTASLVLAPDGWLLVGAGQAVARVSPNLTLVDAASSRRRRGVVSGISVDPGGRVLVRWEDARESPSRFSDGVYLLDPKLHFLRTIEPAGLGGRTKAATFDGAGALVALVRDPGVPFGAPAVAPGSTGTIVTKLPLVALARTARVFAAPAGSRAIDLRWTDDDPAVSGFEIEGIESTGDSPWQYDVAHPVATLARDARSYRVEGLSPGARHRFRLLRVLASGVKTAREFPTAATLPETPLSIAATAVPPRGFDVDWDTQTNGDATGYQLERRVGLGPWVRLGNRGGPTNVCLGIALDGSVARRRRGASVVTPTFADLVPATDEPVRYRVRAAASNFVTEWVESASAVALPTLRVAQTSGSVRPLRCDRVIESMSGRIESADPAAPLVFDPATQDLRVVVGDAAHPNVVLVHAGDPGWTTSGTEHRCVLYPLDELNRATLAVTIVLDVGKGTFHVHASTWADRFGRSADTVAVGFEFGSFHGGDVRTWTRTGGLGPSLELR